MDTNDKQEKWNSTESKIVCSKQDVNGTRGLKCFFSLGKCQIKHLSTVDLMQSNLFHYIISNFLSDPYFKSREENKNRIVFHLIQTKSVWKSS